MKTVYEIYPDIEGGRDPRHYPDIQDRFFWRTFETCKPFSLLGVEAFYNLFRSVEYLARNQVPGAFVECGVFLGGAVLAMSEFARHWGLIDRPFYLYDTFAGFPPNITELDFRGQQVPFTPHANFLDQVRRVIAKSSYPADLFQFIPGPVEETLTRHKPEAIALLRLDTDYYESTRVELNELYPRLTTGGVMIIDDYGHFQGARRATDEFFAQRRPRMLLSRINYSVRAGVKPG